MSVKFPEYKGLDLSGTNKEIVQFWKDNKTFERSIEIRKEDPECALSGGHRLLRGPAVVV